MRWKTILAVTVALCPVTTAYADYWVETFDNGPTGGFDQVWTPHDWGPVSVFETPAQVYTISPATGGLDNSYYGVFGTDRVPFGGAADIYGSEDTGEFPPNSALQFASVDAVTFDDNDGHLYVEVRVNPAGVSARNIPFVTTNMQVNTVPGDLFQEQFYFLSMERNPDQDPPEPTTWEADVGVFDPITGGGVDSYGFAESGSSGPRPDGMEGQPYTGEYILGFWVIPNADQYDARPDIPAGATLLFGDIRQADGTVISQSNDDNGPDGVSEDWDETGNELPPGPVGIGFYNDGTTTFPSQYEDITIDAIVALTYYDGDFDADGDVDGADFLVWQAGFGTATYASPRNGDADWDADVDADDNLLWQANFGVAASAASGMAGVPEPSSFVLLLFGGLSLLAYARRRS